MVADIAVGNTDYRGSRAFGTGEDYEVTILAGKGELVDNFA